MLRSPFSILTLCAVAITGLTTMIAQAQQWSPIACPDSRLIPEKRFHKGQTLDNFSSSKWVATDGEQNARASVKLSKDGAINTLKVDFEFIGKPKYEYVNVENPLPIPADTQVISYLVKPGAINVIYALRIIDANGETHQYIDEDQKVPGWHRVYFNLKSGSSWGGDENKKMDPPLKLGALLFDRPTVGYKSTGSIQLADLNTATPITTVHTLKIETLNKRFGNVYLPGEIVSVRATGEAAINWSILNYFGEIIATGSGSNKAEAVYTPRIPGYYAIRFEVKSGEDITESQDFSFAVLPRQGEVKRGGFLGFCTHYGQSAYPLETMDLMKRYGFTSFRDEISWGSVEQEKDKYTIPPFSKSYLEHARSLGMEPLIIFDYANRLYENGGFPNSPEGIAGYAAYCSELAKMTKGYVNNFEIWNEWIGGCGMDRQPGDHGPEAYGRMMKAAAAAIREARPDATIVGVGGEYGANCPQNVATIFREGTGKNIDAFSIHPYRYPSPPEKSDLVGEVTRITETAVIDGAPNHVWVTEIGYPTHLQGNGVDLTTQAYLGVRTTALLQASLKTHKMFWYDFKDDGLDPIYNENNFGVIRHQDLNCAPKPAIVAFSVFARITSAAKPVGINQAGSIWIAKYRRPDNSELNIVWSSNGPAKIAITGKGLQSIDLMGNIISKQPAKATEYPIYITGKNLLVKGL